MSPRVESKLVAGASQFEDPEVEKFLAAERAAQNPPAPYPSYRRTAGVAEVPAGMGVALKAERDVAVDGKGPVLLHGAKRLPMGPEDLVKPDNKEYNRTSGLLQADGSAYAAVATIPLLVLGTSDGKPKVYRLALPVPNVADGAANGQFAIDLLQLPEFPIADQTLFLYAFSREWASEPRTTKNFVDIYERLRIYFGHEPNSTHSG